MRGNRTRTTLKILQQALGFVLIAIKIDGGNMRIFFAVLFVCFFSVSSFAMRGPYYKDGDGFSYMVNDSTRMWQREGSIVSLDCWALDGYLYYKGSYRFLKGKTFDRKSSYFVVSIFSSSDGSPSLGGPSVSQFVSDSEIEWYGRILLSSDTAKYEPFTYMVGEYSLGEKKLENVKVLESQD
ncbi:hypothetical protein HTZ97_13700 [Desulfuromonas acetoxidans]|uniref:hypothetical protein n=1 Tax=Desulfuromonas acetoxidans TaxID=891 RepID=UPI0015934F3A|nr:hypothetical protein [Desulfuromonas acetoxidans]MBF0644875.1 hypothetical protein [Desulfuromonas acetoxidans]NVD25392.1 hypothetical protein [Desulfuromonas acetoxidans]NVE17507.1 hypothetical protein [Desulfuromonas acetoxidans]